MNSDADYARADTSRQALRGAFLNQASSPVPEAREIPSALEQLERTLGTCDGLIGKLVERLTSALRPMIEAPGSKAPSPHYTTTLGNHIGGLTQQVQRLNDQLEAIISAVAL